MNVLFEDVIQSINFDQHEIIKNILELYAPDGIDLDPTYNKGGFYKAGISRPRYKSDINPAGPEIEKADCRNLPYKSQTMQTIIFDPPFLFGGGEPGAMSRKYGNFQTLKEGRAMYRDSMLEFHRILKPQGILIFKCQDVMHGRKNFFMHVDICMMAEAIAFVPVDLFIKLNRTAMIPHNFTNQQSARKMHSYFWVFRKPGRP